MIRSAFRASLNYHQNLQYKLEDLHDPQFSAFYILLLFAAKKRERKKQVTLNPTIKQEIKYT